MSQRHRIIHSIILLLVSIQLIATGCTLGLERKFESKPLFHTIPANVGVSVTKSFRNSEYRNIFLLFNIDFGKSSVSLFSQVFESMFENITVLPELPPWMTYEHNLDAIIEMESNQIDLSIGSDFRTPEMVTVSYKICLYKADGDQINCWTTGATKSHQRVPFELPLLSSSIEPIVEEAMRAAIADFMVTFEKDILVKEWKSSL